MEEFMAAQEQMEFRFLTRPDDIALPMAERHTMRACLWSIEFLNSILLQLGFEILMRSQLSEKDLKIAVILS